MMDARLAVGAAEARQQRDVHVAVRDPRGAIVGDAGQGRAEHLAIEIGKPLGIFGEDRDVTDLGGHISLPESCAIFRSPGGAVNRAGRRLGIASLRSQ